MIWALKDRTSTGRGEGKTVNRQRKQHEPKKQKQERGQSCGHRLCSDVTSRMFEELKLERAFQIRFQYQVKNCTHLTLTVTSGSAYTKSAFLLSPATRYPSRPGYHLEKQLPVGEGLSSGTQHTPLLPHPTFPVPAYSDGLHPLLGVQTKDFILKLYFGLQ